MTAVDPNIVRVQVEAYRAEIERHRADVERWRAENQRQLDGWRPAFEAVIRFADITIRSLLLLNGGSALALLSFAGNAASHGDRLRFVPSLIAFGVGAALSVLTAGLAYLAQNTFVEFQRERLADWIRWVAVACAFAALGAFCAGMGFAAFCLS